MQAMGKYAAPVNIYETDAFDNSTVYEHGAEHGVFKEMIQRIRYDFELTKTELIKERFVRYIY